MNFLVKIENLINFLLIKLGELMVRLMPAPVKNIFTKLEAFQIFVIQNFKQLPKLTLNFILKFISTIKATLAAIDFKAAFQESYKKATEKYKTKTSGSSSKLKTFFLTPFYLFAHWLQGLSPAQSLLLLTFTAFSVLSIIGIGFSGKRIADNHLGSSRAPASVEEEILYERPEYYKKQTRFYEMTSLRLPVYFAQVNEIHVVDIDFVATISNRHARMFLDKHTFQLIDHLILQIEPSVASFPLEDEGKEIIRRKLILEINDFLKLKEVEGEVTELKITYVLAN